MSRVTSGPATAKRHKSVIKKAKGYYGRRKNTFRVAVQAVERPASTPIATVAPRSAISAPCGSSASMPAPASTR